MSQLPKYVLLKNGKNLQYQRKVPKRLSETTGCNPVFQKALGLTVGATETQIHNAVGKAHESYELHCKMLSNSEPDALTDSDLDLAAAELIRKIRKKPGEYAWLKDKTNAIDRASVDIFGNDEDIYHLAVEEEYYGALSVEQEIKRRAADKLIEYATKKPKTIGAVYYNYLQAKGLTTSNSKKEQRDINRIRKRLDRLIAIIGDTTISDKTVDRIHAALRAYRDDRLNKVSVSSIKRELNDMMGFIKWCREEYGFNWHVNKPTFSIPHKPKLRSPLNKEEQQKLINYCQTASLNKERIAACIALIELQGGLMQSEIKRLQPEHIKLDNEIPYLMIAGDTKTNQRKRLVPIVLGLDFIKANFQEAHSYLNSVTESGVSRKVSDFLKRVTGNDKLTAHCLRHTLRFNTDLNHVAYTEAASIGGWSGGTIGVSQHMLNYGAEGIEYSERVRTILQTSLKIHKHLLQSEPDDSNYNNSNVISFNTANL